MPVALSSLDDSDVYFGCSRALNVYSSSNQPINFVIEKKTCKLF